LPAVQKQSPNWRKTMHDHHKQATSQKTRRSFLKHSGEVFAGTALAGALVPQVHAGEDHTIRLALIGCGGRGGGAVANALSVPGGPVELHAMADLFQNRLDSSYNALSGKFAAQVNVPQDRQFLGFDAYRHAIDTLRPGDVALLTTNAYCRQTHLDYAVEKGINVFMEKSFAPDPGGLRRMMRAGEVAQAKNLKTATGLMCRHSLARQQFISKVRDRHLGDIQLIRAYRMGRSAHLDRHNTQAKENELKWQIRNKSYFFWVSSGRLIEYLIHQIDECCWLKDSWPIYAQGMGGRAADNSSCGQDLDTYSIEYTFADGTKAMVYSRDNNDCDSDFATYVHGTKRAGQFSGNVHKATVHTYKNQQMVKDSIDWSAEKEPCTPWQAEWNVLLGKIRNDQPHNEVERSIKSNYASIMGRAAVHYGKQVTWDQVTGSDFTFCPNVDELGFDSTPPAIADADGRYPVPIAATWSET
jgi:predicted dehydrogenase